MREHAHTAYNSSDTRSVGMTMKLVLIRHGESEWNKLNLFTGWTDVDLSEAGRREAAAGGRALADAGCRLPTRSTAT